MLYIALMLSNYFHDLSVAVLASNVIVIHLAGRLMFGEPGREKILASLVGGLSRVTWWVLGYVILAGAVRAWFFMDFEWNPLLEKNSMLIALAAKHILMFGLTIFGILGMRRIKEQHRVFEG